MVDKADDSQFIPEVPGSLQHQKVFAGITRAGPHGSIKISLAFHSGCQSFPGFSVVLATFEAVAALAKSIPVRVFNLCSGPIGFAADLPIIHGADRTCADNKKPPPCGEGFPIQLI